MTIRARWVRIALLAAAILYVGYWLYRFTVGVFGPLAPLPLGFLAVVLVIVAAWWSWRRFRQEIDAAAYRGAEWIWGRTENTAAIVAIRSKFPWAVHFAAARIDPREVSGLGLSLGVSALLAAVWAFAVVAFQVVNGTSIAATDHRIVNLFAVLRTPSLDRFMFAVTYLGSGRTLGVLAAVGIIISLLCRKHGDALAILLSLVASSIFFSAVKILIGRPRPPIGSARIAQAGFSFPSGHATTSTALYGILAFLLVRELGFRRGHRVWREVAIILSAVGIIALIGFSRVYLGVHYPSDVLAGWTGGAMWIISVFLFTRIRSSRSDTEPPARIPAEWTVGRWLTSAGVLAVGGVYLVLSYPPVPLPPIALPEASNLVARDQVVQLVLTKLPHHTGSLFGHRQEPINLVFIGTPADIEHAFGSAGWFKAEQLNWTTFVRATRATLTHSADPAGPVTPSFVGEAPESMAFNQPVGKAFATRHHIRIWHTRYEVPGGKRVWLATASYDEGFAIATGSLLPVHEIAPDIDTERDYVVASLEQVAAVTFTQSLQIVPPEMGTNSFGSSFFTYGRASLLWL
jgi:membrane-associated phospholipid phosphatase